MSDNKPLGLTLGLKVYQQLTRILRPRISPANCNNNDYLATHSKPLPKDLLKTVCMNLIHGK